MSVPKIRVRSGETGLVVLSIIIDDGLAYVSLTQEEACKVGLELLSASGEWDE